MNFWKKRTKKKEATELKSNAEKAVSVANKNAADAVAIAKKADARYQKEKGAREKSEKKFRDYSLTKLFGGKSAAEKDDKAFESLTAKADGCIDNSVDFHYSAVKKQIMFVLFVIMSIYV